MLPGGAILAAGWILALGAGAVGGLAARTVSRAIEPTGRAAR
jgi:hypothetical protein